MLGGGGVGRFAVPSIDDEDVHAEVRSSDVRERSPVDGGGHGELLEELATKRRCRWLTTRTCPRGRSQQSGYHCRVGARWTSRPRPLRSTSPATTTWRSSSAVAANRPNPLRPRLVLLLRIGRRTCPTDVASPRRDRRPHCADPTAPTRGSTSEHRRSSWSAREPPQPPFSRHPQWRESNPCRTRCVSRLLISDHHGWLPLQVATVCWCGWWRRWPAGWWWSWGC